MTRFLGAAIGAAGVTYGLFFLMQYLIATSLEDNREEIGGGVIELLRVERESDVQTKRRLPKQAQEKNQPTPPKMDVARAQRPSTRLNVGGFTPQFDLAGGPGLGDAPSDAEVMPIVRVPPQYPNRAAERGIQGWVLLEFSITKSGTVDNVEVVDADPPNIFNRSAIRAVQKWKYRPKIQDGQPVERHGVQTVITFELEGS